MTTSFPVFGGAENAVLCVTIRTGHVTTASNTLSKYLALRTHLVFAAFLLIQLFNLLFVSLYFWLPLLFPLSLKIVTCYSQVKRNSTSHATANVAFRTSLVRQSVVIDEQVAAVCCWTCS